jgi:rod shape-determining protein MreD
MRVRATWRIWFVLILALAIQTTWLANWHPFGTYLDLPLLTVVSVSMLLGWPVGPVYGLIAGLLTGYAAAFNLGSFAVSRAVVGAVSGSFEKRFSADNPLAPIFCAAGAVVISNVVFAIMSPADFGWQWWLQRTLSGVVLHAVCIVPLHLLLARLVLPPSRLMFSGG